MSLYEIMIFAGIAVLLTGTPGPSVILLISNAIRYGFRISIIALTGDLLGIVLLASLSALGASAILLANVQLFNLIKLIGAAYLLWIGISILIRAYKNSANPVRTDMKVKQANSSSKRLWLQSFLIAISNPKAILFFGALFPQFINTDQALLFQFLVLTVTFVTAKFVVLGFYAFIASRVKDLSVKPIVKTLLESLKGLMFVSFGLLLLKNSSSKS